MDLTHFSNFHQQNRKINSSLGGMDQPQSEIFTNSIKKTWSSLHKGAMVCNNLAQKVPQSRVDSWWFFWHLPALRKTSLLIASPFLPVHCHFFFFPLAGEWTDEHDGEGEHSPGIAVVADVPPG